MWIFAFQKIASVIDAEASKGSSVPITDAIGPDQKTKKNNNKIINNYTKLSLLNCIIFIVINFVKYFFKSIAIKKYTYTNKKNKSK